MGLFFGANKSEDQKKPEENKTGLFAAGSLFGNTAQAPPAGGLFGKPPTGGSLFGNPTSTAPGQSLFGGANAGSGLFKFTAPPPAAQKQDEDDDGDDLEEGEKSPPIYADSTTKVEFKGAGAQNV